MKTLRTTASVIDQLGGNGPVADLLDTNIKAVSHWRGQGRFPAYTYRALRDALAAKEFAARETLWVWERRRSA